MMAQQTGQPPPERPELPPEVPQLWPGLLPFDLNPKTPFNDQPWEFFAKDFRDLIKSKAKEIGG